MTQISDTRSTRQQIRQHIRQLRRTLTPEQQASFAALGANRMMAYPPVTLARTVALFLSFDGELDTRPLIEQLWRAGKRVYLPVLHPFSPGNLLFLHYHPQSELAINRLKIHEPKLDVRDVLPLSQLDVLITPLVAFDALGQRLGMGGGFTTGRCKTGASILCSPSDMPTIASRLTYCRRSSGISRCPR
ncbi:5-formyltetrahydrofolate cyclo-ligase family protein [Raoultella terrigena]|uniref:5-formyltetrahydrofolate cyclo-ligase n=1 Tax=Raoultella terrigena TaxID=577 RepID=A0A4U9D333_RAOTE|nr:5-formyltetrahydrofolate cyclo-ligase family protein [Raoultella terrigena]